MVIPMKASPLVAIVAGSMLASSAYADVVQKNLEGSYILHLPNPVASPCIKDKLARYRIHHPDIGIDSVIENGKVTKFWVFPKTENAGYKGMKEDILSLPYCNRRSMSA
ncbi:TPA: hypothetical protein HA295_04105 [Candidatus Woesearchaeota archaeon]|nr:hypothetical protein [Candidatus Woesearchaeota archaeon]HII65932.1 hypothetical protein [Candidatus Woesearchaeota archaeon]